MTLKFLSLHTNDYACWEGNAEHCICMYKVRGLRTLWFLHCPPSTRNRSYANSGIRVSHQTSHIFTCTLSECNIVRVNVAIVYGDDSFVASV